MHQDLLELSRGDLCPDLLLSILGANFLDEILKRQLPAGKTLACRSARNGHDAAFERTRWSRMKWPLIG